MAERAQVTSVEAIESFRASLILFLSKARPTLEEICSDVTRMRLWLQNEQRNRWQTELRLRRRELERAQAELFSARLSKLQHATAAQEMALHRAQAAVREAEAKLRLLKRWDHELENRAAPLVKLVDQLHGFLTKEMGHAVAYLAEVVKTLDSYAEVAPRAATAPAQPSAPTAAEQGDNGHERSGTIPAGEGKES